MKNESSYIGIFDSGIGGLTVARSVFRLMPNENIIYFGDTAHLPYGTKSDKQIREYAVNDVTFLQNFDIKALVIACNTADSVARETLEKKFHLPIFGVIEPASKRAAKITKNGRIGIMATKATVNSHAYDRMIRKYNPDAQVFSLACPLLVPLVENGRYQKDDPVVRLVLSEYLEELKKENVDTIVLGCTHYPLLEEAVRSLVPELSVISSSEAAARSLKAGLEAEGLLKETSGSIRRYYVSDDAEHFRENALIFVGDQLCGEVEQVTV